MRYLNLPAAWAGAWALIVAFGLASAAPLPDPGPLTDAEIASIETQGPPKSAATEKQKRKDYSIKVPKGSKRMPRAGKKNSYNLVVSPELEVAYDTYLGGDGERALAALRQADAKDPSNLRAWHHSFLRAQVLIMMGRASDALDELAETAQREVAFTGSDLNSRALRGEAKLWLGDYRGAMTDFWRVAVALEDWRMPTRFRREPDIVELFVKTTAQLRAHTGMAGALVLQGKYEAALKWAEDAEARFADVHYVANHGVYGGFVQVHADSFYGRALTLSFFGAARIVTERDPSAADGIFEAAVAFFDTIGYARGRVTADSLRARALYDIGRFDAAERFAMSAATLAAERGLPALAWRTEALRGEALLQLGRKAEAEGSFRRAQAALAVLTNSMNTDRARLRFGVGKEDITYRLAQLDAERGDMASLFVDLERGRARAFVDLLAGRFAVGGREQDAVKEIRDLERRVLRQRLINQAPGASVAEGVANERALLAERRKKLSELRGRDPELADVLSIEVRNLAEVQARLADGEVMVYALPARLRDPLRLLLVTSTAASLQTLTMRGLELQSRLGSFVRAVENGEATTQSDEMASLGNELHIAEWPAERAVYFVPSGDSNFIPWGAIDLAVPVTVLPVGGWLNRVPTTATAVKRASVIGDPATGGALPRLPGARTEAINIAKLYGVTPILGQAATEAALRADIGPGVDVLHIATHGVFDASDPLQSAIVLSSGGNAAPLTAGRLFEAPLRAKLVVLSACETGMGTTIAGDDLLGLARSFYLGGTITILSSLWPVEDRGTRRFMEVFHERAVDGDYGAAWLAARDRLKAEGFPPAVYGAFVLGGALRG